MTILAGDIGGTKVNLGWYDAEQPHPDGRDAPAPCRQATFLSAGFGGLAEVIGRFLEELGGDRPARFDAAVFGVAGPVLGDRVETPNLPWVIDGGELAARFALGRVELMNDLVATAHGIPALLPAEFHVLQPGVAPKAVEAAALIAAGTGLGMTLLAPGGDGWRPLASEGGHGDLALHDEWGIGLLHFLQREFPDHVSAEQVVSGPGILRIYRYLVESGAALPEPEVRVAIKTDEAAAPAVIGLAGVEGRCPACVATLEHFARLYGAVAGDLALMGLARGGVFVGGGIAPKILPALDRGGFIEAFVDKGRYRGLLERVPVQVLLQPEAALLGAARRAMSLSWV